MATDKQELEAEFSWGILLAADSGATDEMPAWDRSDSVTTASADSLAIAVLHGQEGSVHVSVERAALPLATADFTQVLQVESGRLVVGDALREVSVYLDLEPGSWRIDGRMNRPREASEVHLSVSRA